MTNFEATNSVFVITNENNLFSMTTPGHWQTDFAEKTIDELYNLLELTSQKRFELHVKGVTKKRKYNKKGDNENKLSDFDTQKKTRYLKNQKMQNTKIL